jgi:hypothetical protein
MFLLFFIPLFIVLKMYTFSAVVEYQLHSLDVWFAFRVRSWLLLVRTLLGYDVLIVSGRRTAAEQALLHLQDARNPSPTARPDSHMQGLAVDVNFFKGGANVLRKSSSAAEWRPVVILAQLCGLRWGGNFIGYPDNNHFDGF